MRNVEKIRLPIPLDVHFAILAVVVPKRKREVLDVPVVTRAKRELVMVVLASDVRRDNLVHQAMLRLIHAHLAMPGIIKKNSVKLRACLAFLVNFKTHVVKHRANSAHAGNYNPTVAK